MTQKAGHHHFHRRKRIHQHHEQYPHPNKWVNLLDHVIYAVCFVGPLMTLPQVIKVFALKDAASLSLLSWLTYVLCSFIWVVYGFVHKDKPVIVNSLLWTVMQVAVVVGIIMYGMGIL